MDDLWFVYLARCADGTIYVGIARDVAARIAVHDAGRGARYTRGRGPLRVLAIQKCSTKGGALRLELALKRLARPRKLALAGSRRELARLAKETASRPVAPAAPPRRALATTPSFGPGGRDTAGRPGSTMPPLRP